MCYITTHTYLYQREAGFDLTPCSGMNVRPEGTRELTMPWLMKYSAKYTSPRGNTNPSKPCTQNQQCNQTHTETLKSEVKRKVPSSSYFDDVQFLCEGERSKGPVLCNIQREDNMACVVINSTTLKWLFIQIDRVQQCKHFTDVWILKKCFK